MTISKHCMNKDYEQLFADTSSTCQNFPRMGVHFVTNCSVPFISDPDSFTISSAEKE